MKQMRIAWGTTILIVLACLQGPSGQALSQSEPAAILLIPDSSSVGLLSEDTSSGLQYANIPVRLLVAGSQQITGPIDIYACGDPGGALHLTSRNQAIPLSALQVMDERGQWESMHSLPELEGRQGVRIAVVQGPSARIILRMQLHVPPRQVAGTYEGSVTLEARQR